jgi:signal transduction histidine kinase
MSVLAFLYLLVAALCLLMAGITALVSMAPGWKEERYLAIFFTLAALFNLTNAAQVIPVEDGLNLWLTRFQLLLSMSYLVLYPHYLEKLSLWRRRRWDRPLLALAWLCGLVSMVPGLTVTDEIVERQFGWWGATMREPAVAPGSALFSLTLLALMLWIAAQAASAWRRGEADGGVHVATVGVLFVGVVLDLLTFERVLSVPYLVPVALMVMSVILAAHMLRRFAREALRLERLSLALESEVDVRSRELVKVQAELHRSARVGALGHMVASVAHELNNPLSVIQGNLELLRLELDHAGPGREDAREALEDALVSSRRVAGVVADLLQAGSAALQGAEMMEPVPVLEVLRGSLRKLQDEGIWRRSLQLEVISHGDLYASSNRALLAQVFRKLLLHEQSALSEVKEVARLTISAERKGDKVELVLEDNGQGMSAQSAQALFEPARPGVYRSGLGLAITRGIVQSLGGQIRAESELGFGTRVVLRLPASRECQERRADSVVSPLMIRAPRPLQRVTRAPTSQTRVVRG